LNSPKWELNILSIQVLGKTASAQGAVSLESLLIQPVQRIPRYILLIGELHRKTPDDHPDKQNLADAIAAMEGVMLFLDNEITSHEHREKFLNMTTNIRGAYVSIISLRFFVSASFRNLFC
jgi:hypothetical protein